MVIRALTAVFIITFGAALATSPASAQSVRDRLAKDAVIAVVNDQQILSSEIIQVFQALPRQQRQRAIPWCVLSVDRRRDRPNDGGGRCTPPAA